MIRFCWLRDFSIGGRSYRIHNVKKTYAQWEVVDNHGSGTWRRMLYQERMRRVDDGIFTAFDFPDCGQVRAKRPVSTTPLQTLNMLNSDFVIEQSQQIAEPAIRNTGSGKQKSIDRCFKRLLGRAPDEQERQACLELARANNLSLVCRAIINTNEFTFLPCPVMALCQMVFTRKKYHDQARTSFAARSATFGSPQLSWHGGLVDGKTRVGWIARRRWAAGRRSTDCRWPDSDSSKHRSAQPIRIAQTACRCRRETGSGHLLSRSR